MKLIALFFSVAFGCIANAQNTINVVPMPSEVKMGNGNILINPNTQIVLEGSNLEKCAALLNDYLFANYGMKLKVVKKYSSANSITLNYERLDNELPGAYNLTADKKGIYIAGDNEQGVFYGIQTLLQLLPVKGSESTLKNYPLSIPQLSINDHPRFAYRGMHLDVARHFFPISFIKKYIDYLAAYKYNTFHWHLTDDQGWRIEIKKYPLLTKVGGCRAQTLLGKYGTNKYDGTKYCGYYTQDEIKEIVKYAADRYITVIPEIEMPGHSMAALASYPYLGCAKGPYKTFETWGVIEDVYCAGNDSTFAFLQNVLDEVMQLFPGKYIHIGGDECPKERWKACPLCQKRIKNNNLKDEHALQSYFIQRIEKYLNSKGRKIIGWDEILEGGLAPNATVMSWRGEEGGIEAAKQNHDVIMTPGDYCYLDHSQSKNEDSLTIGGYLPLEKVYNYEPIPAVLNAEQAKHILGAQGNVWTEYIANTRKVEYMIFPRMIALSEVLWSPKDKRNYADFERRLPAIFERLDKNKTNYSKAYYDLQSTVLPDEKNNGILWKIENKNANSLIRVNYWNGHNIIQMDVDSIINGQHALVLTNWYAKDSFIYKSPLKIDTAGFYEAFSLEKNNGKLIQKGNSIKQSFYFNKATGKKITLATPPSSKYPGDGAFTLVNSIQNNKGTGRSSEFLGFSGTDLDATIDLGAITNISKVTVHFLDQPGSWIYAPSKIEVQYLMSLPGDDKAIMAPAKISSVDVPQGKGLNKVEVASAQSCRYIRVIAKNFGTIPPGNPGAGTPAWLFVDEIEAE